MSLLNKLNPFTSLQAQIGFASAGITLLLSLVLSYYAAANSRQQTELNEGDAFVQQAKNVLDVIDRGMFERSREIQNAAILDDIRSDSVPVDHKREFLERLQRSFSAYAWIGICDANGIGLVGTGKYLEGKDLSRRPWCAEGRKGPYIGDMHDALLLSSVLPNPSGEMFYLVDVAAPIHDKSGKFTGVLCGHIFWKWAEDILSSRKTDEDIFLLSKDGLVLSGPSPARSDFSRLAPATMQAIQQSGNNKGFLVERWSDGNTYLVGYAKSSGYRDFPGMGWVSVVREDAAHAFIPAIELRNQILAVGVTLGLVFAVLGWLLAGRIAQPISRISETANRIAAGDLSAELPKATGNDTVLRLSSALREMVHNLTQEIQQRRRAEVGLRLSAKVFENNSEAIMVTNANRDIVMINSAFEAMTGYSEAEVIGKRPGILSSGKHDSDFYAEFYRSLNETGLWRGEIWNKRKNGQIYPEWLSVSTLKDETNTLTHYVAVFSDITQRKYKEERIQYLANYDILTDLPNRYLLADRMEYGIDFAQRHNLKLAVLFIDLDHFKNVNDSIGHDVGDELLKTVARRLKESLRRSDTIARHGGDEFVVLLGEMESENQVTDIVEKIMESLSTPLNVGQYHLAVSASIGISVYPADGVTAVQLLRNADLAMYRAKQSGRNRFQYYEEEMNAIALKRLKLESELRIAISKQQLALYYQPKVNIGSGRVVGMETLLRWLHPELGSVPPAEFIPVAEDCGLINEIGEWVIREAAQQLAAWQAAGYSLVPIAVNLSARQLGQKNLVERIKGIIDQAGIPSGLIELELTESSLFDLGSTAMEVFYQLASAGYSLSLDDFGTGYSSLSRLKLLPVKALKIDRSFVHDIVNDENDRSIIKATVVLAHAMGMKVIAEGVESEAQLDFIRDSGCEEYQGYLFSKPVPASEAGKFL